MVTFCGTTDAAGELLEAVDRALELSERRGEVLPANGFVREEAGDVLRCCLFEDERTLSTIGELVHAGETMPTSDQEGRDVQIGGTVLAYRALLVVEVVIQPRRAAAFRIFSMA